MVGNTEPISEADIMRPDFAVVSVLEDAMTYPDGPTATASDYAGLADGVQRAKG